ncbi:MULTISPECIES: endonuclease/exonuclease/phosphatase family protein [Streptomyces]|uniref:Metal-dependent hydrolase n=1 Tax=Streptomyces odorifer TaxID=53450 RepID=A0A7Y6F5J0_9ACTN|nr:endonuclease/exonuclease/phosphatase family protein [Streptomyces odorifer]NUV32267.1 metal-dependent hydrolase [Streptomyces odorifer]NUV36046.1 metal-dependent hydrolase [Streptomyces sp. KAI-27]NUV48869.1 metal-dependent hydrolase [Streptomyces sp. CAI-78]
MRIHLALRRHVVPLLLAIGLVLTASAAAHPATPRPVPLRVATYNIHAGAGEDEVFDLDRQVRALRSLDADVIGLQEVDVHWGERSQWRDLARELAHRLGKHVAFAPIYSLDPEPAASGPTPPRREFGVAVLSRHPVLRVRNHEITRLSTQGENPLPEPAPGFLQATVAVRGLPLDVYATHLDYRPDPAVRAAQVADMLRVMDRPCPGRCPAHLLLGDFNARPDAPELAPLWTTLRDADPGAPTFPASAPDRRIDYVATGAGITVRSSWTAPTGIASDHLPVVADLHLTRR